MKILFLDVDGVLNSRSTTDFQNNLWPVDNYMCFLVGKIQLDTGCSIVVSSSWRHHPDAMELLRKKFNNVIDKTPSLNGIRGDEIVEWLRLHDNVDKYAILDDDSDFYDWQPLFKTTFETGLTDEIAQKVTEHLR